MILFDSHCHLDDRSYEPDLTTVLERAGTAGVAAVMIPGIHRRGIEATLSLVRQHPGLMAAVGIHPHDVKQATDSDLTDLARMANDPTVKAWGEIGLDFNRMFSPRRIQEEWLIRQLETAVEQDLPIIFHERDSAGRLIEMLHRHLPPDYPGVIHCFSGTREELDAYLALGLHIGITGVVTIHKRGAALRTLLPHIPVDRILIETDAPYLTPTPERNKYRRNEPAFVRTVLLKIAEELNRDPETLADRIWTNTCRLYRYDPVPDMRLQERHQPLMGIE